MSPPALADHLEKLAAFVGVARAGSFHAAARKLRLSQPALSIKVKSLESALGLRLLDRSRKGTVLTFEGKSVYAFAQDLLAGVEKFENVLRRQKSGMVGVVAIGTYHAVASLGLPAALARIRGRHPHLNFAVHTRHDNAELLERLNQNELDLVIIAEPPVSRRLAMREVLTDRFGFFIAADSRRSPSKRRAVALDRLRDVPLITVVPAMVGQSPKLDALLQERLLHQSVDFAVDDFETVRALASQGLGVAYLPSAMAAADVRGGRLREIRVAQFPPDAFGIIRLFACTRAGDRRPEVRQVSSLLGLTGSLRLGP